MVSLGGMSLSDQHPSVSSPGDDQDSASLTPTDTPYSRDETPVATPIATGATEVIINNNRTSILFSPTSFDSAESDYSNNRLAFRAPWATPPKATFDRWINSPPPPPPISAAGQGFITSPTSSLRVQDVLSPDNIVRWDTGRLDSNKLKE